MSIWSTYFLPRKIPYEHPKDFRELGKTYCPHDMFIGTGFLPEYHIGAFPNSRIALVGTNGCGDCPHNKGTKWEYVLCSYKPPKEKP